MDGISFNDLTYFDIFVVFMVLIFAVRSFMSGVIKELSGLIGIIGGIYLSFRYAEEVGAYIHANFYAFSSPTMIYLVGFFATFILFGILMSILGAILSAIFSFSGLGIVNRMIGFAFGGLKMFLILSLLMALLYKVDFLKIKINNIARGSVTKPFLLKVGNEILNVDLNSLSVQNQNQFVSDVIDEFGKKTDQVGELFNTVSKEFK